jgi:putative transposase
LRVPISALERDGELIAALNGIVERNNRWGFWKCFDRLRLNGHAWYHEPVCRVYCEMELNHDEPERESRSEGRSRWMRAP